MDDGTTVLFSIQVATFPSLLSCPSFLSSVSMKYQMRLQLIYAFTLLCSVIKWKEQERVGKNEKQEEMGSEEQREKDWKWEGLGMRRTGNEKDWEWEGRRRGREGKKSDQLWARISRVAENESDHIQVNLLIVTCTWGQGERREKKERERKDKRERERKRHETMDGPRKDSLVL